MHKKRDGFWITLVLGLLVIILLWMMSPWLAGRLHALSIWMAAGGSGTPSMGDQFNVINTLFTGLAFGIIAISLWYQRRDIQLQQQALLDQKDIFKRQLRLTAAKEIVDSLPHFVFITALSGKDRAQVEIGNTGAEVYGMEITAEDPAKWELYYPTRAIILPRGNVGPVEGFDLEAKVATWNVGSEAGFRIKCELRSGESVVIPYVLNLNTSKVTRAVTLQKIISDLLDRTLQ